MTNQVTGLRCTRANLHPQIKKLKDDTATLREEEKTLSTTLTDTQTSFQIIRSQLALAYEEEKLAVGAFIQRLKNREQLTSKFSGF